MNPFEGKKSKYIQKKGEKAGRIELRSEKSARNIALTRKKRGEQKKFVSELSKKHPVLQEHVKAGLKLGLLKRGKKKPKRDIDDYYRD